MIKILYIVPNLKSVSGVISVIMNYYRNINKENIQIDFLVMNNKENCPKIIKELEEGKSKIFYLKTSSKKILGLKKEVSTFFKEHKYSIVELHAPTFSFLFMKEAKEKNIPIRIIHTHSTSRSTNIIKNIISALLNINMKKYANVYFSCSNKSGIYWYGKNIVNSSNYHIITNGVDINKYKYSKYKKEYYRKKYNLENNFVIGFVGRLSKDKNLEFLLSIIKKIIKENKNIKLLLVGDGEERKKLEKKSIELSDNIIFIGRKNNVNEILSCFDILVLTSKKEGLPMVTIEAQMTGIPCVVSNTITNEIDIGNVEFLPLNKQAWIKKILTYKVIKKKKINKERYDIINCCKNLEKIYIEYYEKGLKYDI